MPFTDHLSLPPADLLHRLCQVSEELASTYHEIGLTKAAEFQKRCDAWSYPRENSVTARNNDTHYAAATETISLIELEAQEKALTEEKYLIIRLLDHLNSQCLTSRTPTRSTG